MEGAGGGGPAEDRQLGGAHPGQEGGGGGGAGFGRAFGLAEDQAVEAALDAGPEVVAGRIEWVQSQPFAMGARAVGSTGLDFFGRHVWPYLRPAPMVELSFQAAAVLVLLAELGFLQYYLGGFTNYSEDTQGVAGFHLANTPELGQLLSDVRLYALRNQFFPVLVPAAALALAALGFEIIGRAFRGRTDLPA